MPAPLVLDASVLERLGTLQTPGEPDIVREILRVFLDDTPRRIRALRAAAVEGHAVTAERIGHSLKTTAAMLGAAALSQAAEHVETRAAEAALAAHDAAIAAVEREFERLRETLRDRMDAGSR